MSARFIWIISAMNCYVVCVLRCTLPLSSLFSFSSFIFVSVCKIQFWVSRLIWFKHEFLFGNFVHSFIAHHECHECAHNPNNFFEFYSNRIWKSEQRSCTRCAVSFEKNSIMFFHSIPFHCYILIFDLFRMGHCINGMWWKK